jgi:YesN/AraC family two-component response regulator
MKVKFIDAAKELNCSLDELLKKIASLDKSLDVGQIWPEIDYDFIATLKAIESKKEVKHHDTQRLTDKDDHVEQVNSRKISPQAKIIIQKLKIHHKWGSSTISIDGLANITHISKAELSEALKELQHLDILEPAAVDKRRISLNPKKKAEIESIKMDDPVRESSR